MRGNFRRVAAADFNNASVRQIKTGDDAQQGRLAAAGRAEQRKEFAFANRYRNAGERLHVAKASDQMFRLNGESFRHRLGVKEPRRSERMLNCLLHCAQV